MTPKLLSDTQPDPGHPHPGVTSEHARPQRTCASLVPTLRPKTREHPAQRAPQRGTSRCEAHSAPQNTRIPRTAGPTTGNLTLRGPLCAPKHANTPHSGPHNERFKYDGGPAPSAGRHRAAVVNDTQTPERHPTRSRTPTSGRHQRICVSPANMRVTRPRATPPKHANTPHSRPHNEEPHVARPTLRPKTREYPAQRAPQRTLKVRRRPGTFHGKAPGRRRQSYCGT